MLFLILGASLTLNIVLVAMNWKLKISVSRRDPDLIAQYTDVIRNNITKKK